MLFGDSILCLFRLQTLRVQHMMCYEMELSSLPRIDSSDADVLFHKTLASLVCECLQKENKINSKDLNKFMLVCNHSHIVNTSMLTRKKSFVYLFLKQGMHNNILLYHSTNG